MENKDYKKMFDLNKHYFYCLLKGYGLDKDYNGYFFMVDFKEIRVRSYFLTSFDTTVCIETFYKNDELITILKQFDYEKTNLDYVHSLHFYRCKLR